MGPGGGPNLSTLYAGVESRKGIRSESESGIRFLTGPSVNAATKHKTGLQHECADALFRGSHELAQRLGPGASWARRSHCRPDVAGDLYHGGAGRTAFGLSFL